MEGSAKEVPGGIIRIASYKVKILVVIRKRELEPMLKYEARFPSEKATNASESATNIDCKVEEEIRTKLFKLKQGGEVGEYKLKDESQ